MPTKNGNGNGGLAPMHGGQLALLTAGVALATFMEVLDISIVNVSVRTIAGNLGVSSNEGTMAISAYSMASAVMQPLTGWVARRFGEVRTFTISVMLFVVFSALCGLAQSMPMLILFRLLQGAVSGPMVPLSQTLLLNNYPPKRRPIALALWAMTVVVAPVFGPILGGWITDNYHWSWIFFINIPVGLFAVIITITLLRGRESKVAKVPIDAVGLFLLAVGVGCLQFMLDNGNDHDWFASPLILTLGLVAVVALTFLVIWELTAKYPVVDLSLFSRRNFTVGVTALSLGMLGFFGITVVFPLWLQTTLGYTATWAGLATAPVGILAFLMSPIIGKNIQRLELRAVVTFAFIVFAFTAFWFSTFNSGASFATLVLPRFVMGIGIACFFIPLNQIFLSGLRPDQIAGASGLANFCRTLASSVSTALTVTLWQHRGEAHHASLTEYVNPASPAAMSYVGHLQNMGLHGQAQLTVLDQVVNREALTLAVNDVFWCCGILFLALIPILWLAKPPFGNAGGAAGH
jgi:DHA2 family multidrug resistance protein